MYYIATKSTNQSIVQNAYAPILIDTHISKNGANFAEINYNSVVFKEAGVYVIDALLAYAASTVGTRELIINEEAVSTNASSNIQTITTLNNSVTVTASIDSELSLETIQMSDSVLDILSISKLIIRKVASL